MTDLYYRVLLWHKLLAMQTGSIALCSSKHRLNRDEAQGWADAARNVTDDIEQFLKDGTFILDDRGRRVVKSLGNGAVTAQEVRDVTHSEHSLGNRAVSRKAGGPRIATRKKS